MRIRVYSPNPSRGSLALTRAMGIRRIRREGSRFVARPSDVIINWGGHTIPDHLAAATIINSPESVHLACDKLATFRELDERGVCIPLWTDDRERAQRWSDGGKTVIVRKLTRAYGGKGIVVVEPGGEVPEAPLYTMYRKKTDEYRVHVIGQEVVDVVQKRRLRDEARNDRWDGDNHIRNKANGWIYARDGVERPDRVAEEAVNAVAGLNLHFGAVDIGWSPRSRKATVYEVNTAPGLEGTTVERYRNGLRRFISEASADIRGVSRPLQG